jgi:hypothetical protein
MNTLIILNISNPELLFSIIQKFIYDDDSSGEECFFCKYPGKG